MKRGRIGSSTKIKFRNTIKDVIKGLSQKVQVYKQPIKNECPNCYFDKFSNKSTGKCKWTPAEAEQKQADYALTSPGAIMYKWFATGRCPICKGVGYLETRRRMFVECLVTWNPQSRGNANTTTFTPAGYEGATAVELKTDPKYFDLFNECDKIVVDGVECKVDKPIINRGLGIDSVMVIMAFTTNKANSSSSDITKVYG